jgi:diguanylate cyclase (GGDEF)-like protein
VAVAACCLALLAALIAAALLGRGPLYRRILVVGRHRAHEAGRASPVHGIAISPSVRLLSREPRPRARDEVGPLYGPRPPGDELDEVLHGTFVAETFNRGVRLLAWSFILVVLVAAVLGQMWQTAQPAIVGTLVGAGVFVLVVHELMPATNLGALRVLLEASATIAFLTMLVILTGNATSPFFFMFPLLVGGAALIVNARVTVVLTVEAAAAYGLIAASGYLNGDSVRDSLVRVAINVSALLLLAYAGVVITRLQRRTRDAAIRLSTVDSLTDLYNRAFLFKLVDREIQRSRRFKRGFCLLMMDLDGLKSINDRYGHYQGDLVLRAVASIVRRGLRAVDVPARYGGDEFVALLPETDPSGALLVGEKIRMGVMELRVETAGQTIAASVSIGVVSYPDDGMTADELMIAADKAMYSSKRLGKNRVVGYSHSKKGGAGSATSDRDPDLDADLGAGSEPDFGFHFGSEPDRESDMAGRREGEGRPSEAGEHGRF